MEDEPMQPDRPPAAAAEDLVEEVIAADQAKNEVVVALERGTVVAGVVRRADGPVAAGVRVRSTQPEQWGWMVDSHEAVTDRLGRFRLSGIFPGWVSLHATLHEGDAVWVSEADVGAGSVDAVIQLPPEPVRRRLRLLVKGADGLPVAHARWDAEDGLYTPYSRASSHGLVENGEFVLPADPDVPWVTIAFPKDADNHALPWATTVVGPLGTRGGDLEVVMPRGRAVTGTVRSEQGETLLNVTVFATPLFLDGEVERPVSRGWLVAGTDTDGRFRIEGLPPGRVEVEPYGDGRSTTPRRVSAPTSTLDFVMHRQPRLRGRVRHPDGTPAPEAVIYARRARTDVEPEGWIRVYVKRDGAFSLYHDHRGGMRLRTGRPGSVLSSASAGPVEIEVLPMDPTAFATWAVSRPPP